MKRISIMAAALVLMLSASAFAAEVTGVLVDLACYTKDKANTTNAHKGMGETCAQACAKKGGTVALVTEKGDVYEVMTMGGLAGENNAKLVPHMAHTVTLTGDVMDSKDKKTKMIHATALKMISK
jgi:putative hemolysin